MKRILILAALLFAVPASAATVNVAWDANVETDLAGYRLYTAPMTGGTPAAPVCGPWTLNTTVVAPLTTGVLTVANGRWCSRATAFDTAIPTANESGFSNTITFQVPTDTTPPSVPGAYRLAP